MQCYKSVCYDIEKASKKVHKKQRLNVLYIISDICRRSQARLGVKDKYGMPTDPPLLHTRLVVMWTGEVMRCAAMQCGVATSMRLCRGKVPQHPPVSHSEA